MNGITQKQLANGLTVILKEVHSAPVVSWWVAYRVGSRNERTGQTGISHWVEHMMFKGTPKFPPGTLDTHIDSVGGQWNAFTSMDYTMYFETLPAEHAPLALDVEADRMVNALFDVEETESERTVIISERQGHENEPVFWLEEEMRAAAFRVHGYHHEIIGDMADLNTMTRDDLYNHYRKHYAPSNAIAICVGDFDTATLLPQIEALYGSLPTAPAPELFARPEPEQHGERRIVVRRPSNAAYVHIAHRIPNGLHEDWFKLEILDSVLTGPGGSMENKTSRLYQALMKTGLTASMNGGISETIDPYLYTIEATVSDGRTPQEVEAAIVAELERVAREGITEKELNRAKKQARAAFAYATESVTAQAYWLARSAMLGDVNWFEQYIVKLQAVTLADVQSVAQRYLHADNRITGYLIPAQA